MYKKVNAQAAPLKALQIYCCFSSRLFFKLQLIEIGSALVLFLEWFTFHVWEGVEHSDQGGRRV